MLKQSCLVLFALTLSADPGFSPERLALIPARMQAFVDQGKTAGVVTLVSRHGEVALLNAVGFQDREQRIPMKTDSIFQIMSMSKPVTATAVLILMEEGRLALIDPVEKYLPKFKGQLLADGKKPARPIEIRDLLTHTSGLAAFPAEMDKEKWSHTLEEMVDSVAGKPLQFEGGSRWAYSNSGIATLGRIVEIVTGMPFDQFVTLRILAPLGMKDTHYFLPNEKRGRLAMAYTDDQGALKLAKVELYREGAKYPAPEGGLYSTALDMVKFYQMMLRKGTLGNVRILSPATVELMTRVHTGELKAGFAPGIGFGLGWSVVRNTEGMFRLNSIGTFGHGGAWRTYGWIDPEKDLVGVIMMQRTNGGGDVADEINAFMTLTAAAINR